MKKPLRIGLPRALLFYKYYNQWRDLFHALGLEVITSPMTTREILRNGIRHSVSDLCLSVKSFLGHVYHLKDKVDCLFIPRYVSVEKDAYMCPKILGLPDVVKAVFTNLPEILSPKFNIKEGYEKTIDDFTLTIARFFSLKHDDVKAAYLKTQNKEHRIQDTGYKIQDIEERRQRSGAGQTLNSSLNIGIVGRPYTVLDGCVNKGIIGQLNRVGINAVYIKPTQEEIEDVMRKLPKWVYWSLGKEVVASAHILLNSSDVHGVINIVNAACGPDSFTEELIKRFLKETSKPYMTILVDEHTSNAGIQTRIEAFTDMIMKVGV